MMTVCMKNRPANYLQKVQSTFNVVYDREWFKDPVVAEILLDIDKTVVLPSYHLESPIWGNIAYTEISGGSKGLITILKSEKFRVITSLAFGDNCIPWLVKLSFMTDFTLCLDHCLAWISKYPDGPVPICAQTEDGVILNTTQDVFDYYTLCVSEGYDG